MTTFLKGISVETARNKNCARNNGKGGIFSLNFCKNNSPGGSRVESVNMRRRNMT